MKLLPDIHTRLTEDQVELRDAIRHFVDKEIRPIAADIDRDNVFPKHLWKKMGDMGLLGITVDPAYGGAGLGYVEHVIAMQEISSASASVGLSYGAHSNLCILQISRHGTEAQKKYYLPKLASGEFVGALAISESGAGSDAVNMQLAARLEGGHYLLNGHKMWITNGPQADVIVVYAKTDPKAKANGITAFIVESGFSGYQTQQKMDKLGMRGSDTCELLFNNCEVPEANILGKVNEGVKILMSGLDAERVILAAGPLGIMQACLQEVVPYLAQRKQFNRSIGSFQLMEGKLADMYTSFSASTAYLYSMARNCDLDIITRQDAASVILFLAENATQMALQAIQCFGGNGYTNEYTVSRLLRDAKLYEIGAGTSEIRRLLIGRELMKLVQ